MTGGTDDDRAPGWDVVPRTPKGRRSKEALLTAAREVFRRDGFTNARVSEIADLAEMSNGAFYRYFRDKHDVLMALVQRLMHEMFEFARHPWEAGDPHSSVYETTVRYFQIYEANADLLAVEIESAQTDGEILALWQEARQMFYARIARALQRGQGEGVVRPEVIPAIAAALLGGMTEHYAYLHYVLRERPRRSREEMALEVANLWSHGIQGTAAGPRTEAAATAREESP